MRRREFLKSSALGLVISDRHGLDQANNRAGSQEIEKPKAMVSQDAQQRMHPDFITYIPGVEYFFVGNGDITGVVQYSPKDPQTTFLGFTLMNPERFCRKWSTFLYHPERGLSATKLGVIIDDIDSSADAKSGMYLGVKGYTVNPENVKYVRWKYPDHVPVVSLVWTAGDCEVEEEFFVPHEGSVFFRRVNVKNDSRGYVKVTLSLSLYANFGLFDEIATDAKERTAHAYGVERMKLHTLVSDAVVAGRYDVRANLGSMKAGENKQGVYAYTINNGEKILHKKGIEKMWRETVSYWSNRTKLETGNTILDGFFNASMSGMKAVVARSAKMDAAPWQYNMEWVSDQALALEALLHCGMFDQAKTMIERNLKNSIGFDGRTIESSRWFGFEYTELNQNGMLLYSIWAYLCWTGDSDLVKKYWDKIRLCAEFPLRKEFQGPAPYLMKNKREFWERSDVHGVEDGYEMAYQFWVAFGLEKGAAVAKVLGKNQIAEKWVRKANDIKDAMLNNPVYRLIEDGHFIKRRTSDGRWQRHFVPPDRKRMPPGSPLAIEEQPSPEPDTIEVYPIIYGFVDPKSALAKETLAWVEQLWSHRWEGGGYPRYNTTSEDNPPAAWPFASLLVARAYAEAGDDEKVWRVLKWLSETQGGIGKAWFERNGQSITPPHPPVSIINWTWYEILSLFTIHIIGLRPQTDHLLFKPHLLMGLNQVKGSFVVRGTRISLTLFRSREKSYAVVNGKTVDVSDGILKILYPLKKKLNVEFHIT